MTITELIKALTAIAAKEPDVEFLMERQPLTKDEAFHTFLQKVQPVEGLFQLRGEGPGGAEMCGVLAVSARTLDALASDIADKSVPVLDLQNPDTPLDIDRVAALLRARRRGNAPEVVCVGRAAIGKLKPGTGSPPRLARPYPR